MRDYMNACAWCACGACVHAIDLLPEQQVGTNAYIHANMPTRVYATYLIKHKQLQIAESEHSQERQTDCLSLLHRSFERSCSRCSPTLAL